MALRAFSSASESSAKMEPLTVARVNGCQCVEFNGAPVFGRSLIGRMRNHTNRHTRILPREGFEGRRCCRGVHDCRAWRRWSSSTAPGANSVAVMLTHVVGVVGDDLPCPCCGVGILVIGSNDVLVGLGVVLVNSRFGLVNVDRRRDGGAVNGVRA